MVLVCQVNIILAVTNHNAFQLRLPETKSRTHVRLFNNIKLNLYEDRNKVGTGSLLRIPRFECLARAFDQKIKIN